MYDQIRTGWAESMDKAVAILHSMGADIHPADVSFTDLEYWAQDENDDIREERRCEVEEMILNDLITKEEAEEDGWDPLDCEDFDINDELEEFTGFYHEAR